MKPDHPYLSVIVPAHNARHFLPLCLGALVQSDLPREAWELIVVDDASTDETSLIAARFADTVVHLPGKPHGPAYARNRGSEVARGECLVFIDADVCVHGPTLSQFVRVFVTEPDVSAVFGSYDASPPGAGIVSQYRNLLHHYVHHKGAGDAETFWAGCGAVRTAVFREAGMYDEWHFPRPQIEDIELGHRITTKGYRIVLRPEIQGTHLKAWTLRQVLRTDLRDRGVPWTRLLIQHGTTLKTRSLNLKTIEKLNTVLVALAVLFAAAAAFRFEPHWLLGALACLAPVVVVNSPLYAFFARQRGPLFAATVIPLHLMYYVLNTVSVIFGWLLHETIGAPRPDPTVEAFAEVGVQTWPPVPSKRRVTA